MDVEDDGTIISTSLVLAHPMAFYEKAIGSIHCWTSLEKLPIKKKNKMKIEPGYRIYTTDTSAVFRKTKENFGGLSNMASGYPIVVNDVSIRTSEALYQACRFPHLPDVQKMIINEHSPMTAKMHSKQYQRQSRPDWFAVRVRVMRWCLRLKLAQNWTTFSELLLSTNDQPIVESSSRDTFWGAVPYDNGSKLAGANILGRLLMELRQQLTDSYAFLLDSVTPPSIPDPMLYGALIQEYRRKI